MRALVLTGIGQLELRDVPEPGGSGRAVIAVERGGVCGTDLKLLRGAPPLDYPRILGHELVGTVIREGSQGLVGEGTRVLVDPAVSCGHCAVCRRDRANLCPNGALMGRDVDGGFADQIAVDERQLLPIPDSVSLDDAGLLQVLGVCVHAQTRVEVFPGQTAAVVGLGVGGLLHTQLLRARGINRVLGITRSADKRALAEDLGATVTCHPDDAEGLLEEMTGGAGADLVVESVGILPTLAQSMRLAALGGTVLAYGSFHATSGDLPFYELYMKELDIISSRAALTRDYATSIDLVAAGQVDVASLLSEVFPLEAGQGAFEAMQSRPELVKVVFDLT